MGRVFRGSGGVVVRYFHGDRAMSFGTPFVGVGNGRSGVPERLPGAGRPGRGIVRNAGEGSGIFLPANVSGFVSVWVGEPNETATMCPPRVRPLPVRDGSAGPIRFPAGCTRTRPTFRRPSPGGFGKAVSCIGSVRPRREGLGKDFGPGLRKRIAPAENLSYGGETSYRVRTSARTAGFSVPAVRPSSVPDRRPKRSRCIVRPQRSVLRRI